MKPPKPGGLIANIANALIDHRPLLALPRWRVLADIRATYGCGEFTAREAYALARVAGRVRRCQTTHTGARA
jgi:hypothetical protein